MHVMRKRSISTTISRSVCRFNKRLIKFLEKTIETMYFGMGIDKGGVGCLQVRESHI